MRLIAGVITTPRRQQFLPDLLAVVTPVAEQVTVFNDIERRGNWWNLQRAMRVIGTESARTGAAMLLTDDDMIAPADWYDRWQVIHAEAQSPIYTFMARQRHLFTPDNMARGWVKAVQPRGFYAAAMLIVGRPYLMDEALEWFEAEGRALIPPARQKHLDVVLQDYLVHTGQPWVITTPTLFDHVGGESSTLGHQIGHSFRYIGESA